MGKNYSQNQRCAIDFISATVDTKKAASAKPVLDCYVWNTAMSKIKIGHLPPRYSLLLNSHRDARLSKCPKCRKLTRLRKFALFIHIDGWGPMALGKTCRYCSRCEIVMVHRKELEAELARGLSQMAPEATAKDYLVLGTIEQRIQQEGLGGAGTSVVKMLRHVADFKHQYELAYKPGGWYPVN